MRSEFTSFNGTKNSSIDLHNVKIDELNQRVLLILQVSDEHFCLACIQILFL